MPTDSNSHCLAAAFVGSVPAFALADGTVRRQSDGSDCLRAHPGLLAAARIASGDGLLTAGEDGRVCRVRASGDPEELARAPRKWITSVAQARGRLAYSSGKLVWLHGPGGVRKLASKRNVRDIAFAPDGGRLAIAQQDSITIHATAAADEAPLELPWNDIHHAATFSPDGCYLLVASQDTFMHGWRLADRRHFRMLGYPARVTDWAFSTNGQFFATSGASAAIVWAFMGEDGPMGRSAIEVARREGSVVTAVAWHPRRDVLAIGWSDGAVSVAAKDTHDAASNTRKLAHAPITSVSWSTESDSVAFGSAKGECGVLDDGEACA